MTQDPSNTPTRYNGKVKWFTAEKGFGIITYTSEESGTTEYFAHHSNIKTNVPVRTYLIDNEEVVFTPSSDDNGKLKALDIRAPENKELVCVNKKSSVTTTKRHPKNTTSFKPQQSVSDMRIVTGWMAHCAAVNNGLTSHDLTILDPFFPGLGFVEVNKNVAKEHALPDRATESVWFDFIKEEIDIVKKKHCGDSSEEFMKLWHGDSHLIADDGISKGEWKNDCHRINGVINTIASMFKMEVKSTRVNLYRDGNDWKPYHHDAAAIKDNMKKVQNITVAINFGGCREVSFQNAATESTVSFPMLDGYIYSFGREVNVLWKHGILKGHPQSLPRMSIILWGWSEQVEPQVFK